MFAIMSLLLVLVLPLVVVAHIPNLENAPDYGGDPTCQNHTDLYRDALKGLVPWALKMKNAAANSASGTFHGTAFNLGHWRQCLESGAPFLTHHCLISITTNDFQIDVRLGLCLPTSCLPQDVQNSLDKYVSSQPIVYNYSISVPENMCKKDWEPSSFDHHDTCFCLTCATIVTLVISLTIYECKFLKNDDIEKGPTTIDRLILAFSIRKNWSKLSNQDSKFTDLNVLCGIRAITLLLLIMGNRHLVYSIGPVQNSQLLDNFKKTFVSPINIGIDLLADSFFLASGIVMSYRCGYKNPVLSIITRYLRLTPTLLFVIMYASTMMFHSGNGIFWESTIGTERQNCRRNWWVNVLYVNNFVDPENICIAPTWYLSCNFQLFVLGSLVLTIFKKRRKLTCVLLSMVGVVSILAPLLVKQFQHSAKHSQVNKFVYGKPYDRIFPYVAGLLTGIIFAHFDLKTKPSIPKIISTSVSFASLAALLTCGISTMLLHSWDCTLVRFLVPAVRILWCLAIISISIVAAFGHASLVRSILVWKVWKPLDVLMHAMYLVHFPLQMMTVAWLTSPVEITVFNAVWSLFGDLGVTLIISVALYVFVESPVRELTKIIFVE